MGKTTGVMGGGVGFATGGARPGAGKKKTQATIRTQLMRERLTQRVYAKMDKWLDATEDVACGLWYEKETPDGENRVYKSRPDSKALCHVWDQMIGKARETIELSGEGGGPVRFVVTRIGREK